MSQFEQPTQFKCQSMTIDGQDVSQIYSELSYYENIYTPAMGGSVIIMDSSTAGFIEENQIEFIEDFEFSFTNANGESLDFKGKLNGLRNEAAKQQLKLYTIDFTSEPVRKNEQEFVIKKFKNEKPKSVVEEMVELIGGQMDKTGSSGGEPMNFLGNRRRPTDIIKFVCTHGLSGKSSSDNRQKNNPEPEKKKMRGTTGFLCWETADGYRFASTKEVMDGDGGNDTEEYSYQLQNHGLSLQEAMTSVIDVNFLQIGDYQSHQRGGAFINKLISFDLDTLLYTEFEQKDQEEATGKMKQETKKPTRYFNKPYQPERFEPECQPAQDNKWDQSRRYLSQNAVSQNTAPDTLGNFTIPPGLEIRAGDTFKCKIYKVTSDQTSSGFDRKHSGKYIVKSVVHHFNSATMQSFTTLNTMRSTKQQNDASS